ncbi:MAG: 3-hydroxyacyl-CoA dehydrogenase family protein [Holophaga sp.]|nr:3-hydroxyacyl-CoA dehydrogenase family protein [Holophaga sp.]
MDLNTRMQQVAVVGAAGKMGSGIALLLALELGYRALEHPEAHFVLNLIDVSDDGLQALLRYLREQAGRDGEKQINRLRALFRDRADLVDNQDMVQAFVFEVLLRVRTGTSPDLARDSLLVFEAAFETEEVKRAIYRDLAGRCRPEAFFLSNTSSIPLQGLSEACGLAGRMIGFHFYNPPAVQKLVELIQPRDCAPELARLAPEIARLLRKRTVPASDIAGFIGNGHFIRDGLYAIRVTERLGREHGFVPALFMVDQVSRNLLLRPMGSFQLIDYVGIDVFQLIARVMAKHLGEDLHSELIDRMIQMGVKGGQGPGGVPRAGFLDYRQGRPVAVFDPATGSYQGLDQPWAQAAAAHLGPPPEPALSWKALRKDPDAEAKLAAWFQAIRTLDTPGAAMAREHFRASRATGLELVRSGVAQRAEDVNDVLKLGFFHLYGPITDYL